MHPSHAAFQREDLSPIIASSSSDGEGILRAGGGGGGEGGLHVLEILFKTRRERGGCSEFRMGFLIVICIPRDAGSDFGIRRVIQHYLWLGFLFFQQFLHGSENEIRVMGDVLGSPRS